MSNSVHEVVIYKNDNGGVNLSVRVENETVWLTIDQMSELFNKSRSTINEHILNIYKENELSEDGTVRKIGISDFSTKPTNFYNLDVIISVGYRVKSVQGTRFRQWATQRLKEYIVKGFTMDDERLKGTGGGDYWKDLLDRIRDIRSSEAMKKAEEEYKKYQQKTISPVEKDYLDTIMSLDEKIRNKWF